MTGGTPQDAPPHAPPRSGLARNTALLTTAQLAAQVASVIRAIVIPKLLGPGALGLWRWITILQQYAATVDLGLLRGLERDLPFLLGRRDVDRAEHARDAVLTLSLLLAVALLVVSLAAMPFLKSPLAAQAMPWFGVGVVLQQAMALYHILLRAHDRFRLLTVSGLTTTLVGTAVCVALAFRFSVPGLAAGVALGNAAGLAIAVWRNPARLTLSIRWRVVADLFRIGMPLTVAFFLGNLVRTIDQVVLGWRLGTEALGVYSCGVGVFLALSALPTSLYLALLPELARRCGEDPNPAPLLDTAERAMEATSGAVGVLAGLALVLLPPLLQHFLTAYQSGLAAMSVLVWMAITATPVLAYWAHLAAVRRQVLLAGLLGGAVPLLAAVDWLAADRIGTLTAVAAAQTAGCGALCACMAVASARTAGRPTARSLAAVGRSFLLFVACAAPGAAAVAVLPMVGDLVPDIVRCTVGLVAQALVSCAVLVFWVRRLGIEATRFGPLRVLLRWCGRT